MSLGVLHAWSAVISDHNRSMWHFHVQASVIGHLVAVRMVNRASAWSDRILSLEAMCVCKYCACVWCVYGNANPNTQQHTTICVYLHLQMYAGMHIHTMVYTTDPTYSVRVYVYIYEYTCIYNEPPYIPMQPSLHKCIHIHTYPCIRTPSWPHVCWCTKLFSCKHICTHN